MLALTILDLLITDVLFAYATSSPLMAVTDVSGFEELSLEQCTSASST
jgi:hypothetical protein